MLHFNAQGVKTLFCNRKDEVLIKVLVELGVHGAFFIPTKSSHRSRGKYFLLATTNMLQGFLLQVCQPTLRVSKIPIFFLSIFGDVEWSRDAPQRIDFGHELNPPGRDGICFFSLICYQHCPHLQVKNVASLKKCQQIQGPNFCMAKVFVMSSCLVVFSEIIIHWVAEKTRFRSLGISVVPCWKWLASGKLSEDSKESLRWGMTFLSGGKVVANPTTTFPSKILGWFQSKNSASNNKEPQFCMERENLFGVWYFCNEMYEDVHRKVWGRLYWNHFLEKPQLRLLFRRIQWIPVSWEN